jgi:hypothetical protein
MNSIEIGQFVTRMLAGEIEMQLRVTAITEDRIICGGWEFDRLTGAEIDDDLGWGPPPRMTGSYIKEVAEKRNHRSSDLFDV